MRKNIKLMPLLLLILILSLTACNTSKNLGGKEELTAISPPDFSTEEGIKDYLVGEWVYDYYYRGDVICKMDIDKDLKVLLSFDNSYSDLPQGDYKGKIVFHRIYAGPEDPPDMIRLELVDTDELGGDFFFLHRTLYDGKRVMAWIFTGKNLNDSVFDVEDFTGDFRVAEDELFFEKKTGEEFLEEPYKDAEFHAVYWGTGPDQKAIWLDDVYWTPSEDYYGGVYPWRMTIYENQVIGSLLYKILLKDTFEALGEDLTVGEVYLVKTDDKGNVISFKNAEHQRFMNDGLYINPDDKQMIYDIIFNNVEEIEEYIDMGMDILLTGETTIIDGEEYFDLYLGTNHEESFVREIIYAVNTETEKVYRYDVINDKWLVVKDAY